MTRSLLQRLYQHPNLIPTEKIETRETKRQAQKKKGDVSDFASWDIDAAAAMLMPIAKAGVEALWPRS